MKIMTLKIMTHTKPKNDWPEVIPQLQDDGSWTLLLPAISRTIGHYATLEDARRGARHSGFTLASDALFSELAVAERSLRAVELRMQYVQAVLNEVKEVTDHPEKFPQAVRQRVYGRLKGIESLLSATAATVQEHADQTNQSLTPYSYAQ